MCRQIGDRGPYVRVLRHSLVHSHHRTGERLANLALRWVALFVLGLGLATTLSDTCFGRPRGGLASALWGSVGVASPMVRCPVVIVLRTGSLLGCGSEMCSFGGFLLSPVGELADEDAIEAAPDPGLDSSGRLGAFDCEGSNNGLD
eukprot:785228-Prorocentrum_minimum.AAC.1